jgi:hypothetical protein
MRRADMRFKSEDLNQRDALKPGNVMYLRPEICTKARVYGFKKSWVIISTTIFGFPKSLIVFLVTHTYWSEILFGFDVS